MNNTGNQEINPITRLDYPDPDVIRVDNTYYMVSTTMHFMPGCEILRSYDLVNWEHASYVYDVLDSTPGQKIEGEENIYGQGMWAASLRYHKGIFYVCFVANDTGKTYIYSAPSIEGPWKKSYIKGFYHDCSILFDDDDRVYIASGRSPSAHSNPGQRPDAGKQIHSSAGIGCGFERSERRRYRQNCCQGRRTSRPWL